jgi:arylsulfatase A-like enzyme
VKRRTILALALALAVVAGTAAVLVATRRPRPPVILISLDTLRADCLGRTAPDGRPLMPNLEALALESVTFTRAVAPWPFTLPSHMSMLTGVDPLVHGVLHDKTVLPAGIETLAEVLHRNGYATVGLVSNEWLEGGFGFSRGFDSYHRIRHGFTYAPRLNDAAFSALATLAAGPNPFFLFLHYNDAHCDFHAIKTNTLPYVAAPATRHTMGADDVSSSFCDEKGTCACAFLLAADRERRVIPPERIAALLACYHAGVRQLDTDLAALFSRLKALRVFDRALIIVTSDHGEEFREHGLFLHSQPYQETIAVPLLVKLPGGRRSGAHRNGLVSVTDLTPTILDIVDVPAGGHCQGISLLPSIDKDTAVRHEVLARDKLRKQRWALQAARHKLIWDRATDRLELYDLAADPGERNNLAGSEPGLTNELRRRLAALVAEEKRLAASYVRSSTPPAPLLSNDERERLKSIGYLQ